MWIGPNPYIKISNWQTGNVTDMSEMFSGCSKIAYVPKKFNN